MAAEQLSRDTLLGSLEPSLEVYTQFTTFLNGKRDDESQISVFPKAELIDQALDWVTEDRIEAADRFLHRTKTNPPLLIPMPNVPVTKWEVAKIWESIREDIQGYDVRYGLRTLVDWTDDEISGYREEESSDMARFVILEAAYPKSREGTQDEQLEGLQAAQEESPLVRSATIFEGAFLAGLIKGNSDSIYEKSLIRSIDLPLSRPTPDNRSRPGGPAANLCMDGITTYVGYAPTYETQASRRVVT